MNAPSDAFLHQKLHALNAQADEFIAVRRDIHKHPEMGYKEYRTSDLVAEQLSAWGYQVTRSLGGTGLVGQIKKGTGHKSIGIRADMDALPINEATGLPYASCNVGIMHACGHDGHTAMLLAAAQHLATQGEFDGTLNLIFQPAEEGGGGALKMMEDGLFQRFPCDAIFAMHNMPGYPQGQLVFRSGPTMASSDYATVTLHGHGGHGAMPHKATDVVVAAASLIMALQTVVSRHVDPMQPAVVTVGAVHAGEANNVIPAQARLEISVRALDPQVRRSMEQRIRELEPGLAQPPDMAIWAPDDFAVEPDALAERLLAAAQGEGAKVLEACEVLALEVQGARITGVRTHAGIVPADVVVLANAMGAQSLARQLGQALPIHEAPAVLLRFDAAQVPLRHLLYGQSLEVRPGRGGGLLSAADFPGEAGMAELGRSSLQAVASLFHPSCELSLRSIQAVYRPKTDSGLPLRTFLEGFEGLYVTVAHPGVILAPLIGSEACEDILKGQMP